jgi:methylglutaconyl-CoA hydratase
MNSARLLLDGPVARIALEREESKNSFDANACREVLHALHSAQATPAARAILLEAGGPAFSLGLELGEPLLNWEHGDALVLEQLLESGPHSSKPVVVAVQGAALGVGAALVAGAHVALAAQGASFGFTEIRAGLWPFTGWKSIERALGRRRALALTLTGRIFSAAEALTWGLIDEITQPSELEDRAFATASLLAAAPPGVVKHALEFIREPGEPAARFLSNLQSADAREGVSAFLEKRRPCWPPVA